MTTILDILLHEYRSAQELPNMEKRFIELKNNIDEVLESLNYYYCHCNRIHSKSSNLIHKPQDEVMPYT